MGRYFEISQINHQHSKFTYGYKNTANAVICHFPDEGDVQDGDSGLYNSGNQ